jgi:acyl-CoA thioesterase I
MTRSELIFYCCSFGRRHATHPDRDSLYSLRIVFLLIATFVGADYAYGADAIIVALGASNTYGEGVTRGEDYPAQLEALLRTKRHNVSVVNAGISGDTTDGMLSRLESVTPPGTKVVILQPGGNDKRQGLQSKTAGNIAEIRHRMSARNIALVVMDNGYLVRMEHSSDNIHLTAGGYRRLAEEIMPQVERALSRK